MDLSGAGHTRVFCKARAKRVKMLLIVVQLLTSLCNLGLPEKGIVGVYVGSGFSASTLFVSLYVLFQIHRLFRLHQHHERNEAHHNRSQNDYDERSTLIAAASAFTATAKFSHCTHRISKAELMACRNSQNLIGGQQISPSALALCHPGRNFGAAADGKESVGCC
jgi:hypothetical protein